MKKNLFILFICCLYSISCKQEAPSQTSLMGYKYQILKKGTGKKAKAGDYAYFNIITMIGDSLLEDTHIYPFQPSMLLETKPLKAYEAVMDVMKEMSIGDSVKLMVPIDSLRFAKIEYQSYKQIDHIITLDHLKDESQYTADQQKRQEFLQSFADSLFRQDSVRKMQLVQFIKDYNDKKMDNQLKTTTQGVKYLILKDGQGPKPTHGDMIEVNYVGALTNEFIFDSSFPRGQPYVYRINTGQVIKGWDEGLINFNEGTEAILCIPASLGYGKAGSSPNIPPDSELIFYVNLFKVRSLKL